MHPRPTCTTTPFNTSASPLSQPDNCFVNSPSLAVTLPCLSPTNTSLRMMEWPKPREGSKYDPCAYAATPESGIATLASNSATSTRRQPFMASFMVRKFLIVNSPYIYLLGGGPLPHCFRHSSLSSLFFVRGILCPGAEISSASAGVGVVGRIGRIRQRIIRHVRSLSGAKV